MGMGLFIILIHGITGEIFPEKSEAPGDRGFAVLLDF
jgi:hypothetical protein